MTATQTSGFVVTIISDEGSTEERDELLKNLKAHPNFVSASSMTLSTGFGVGVLFSYPDGLEDEENSDVLNALIPEENSVLTASTYVDDYGYGFGASA